MSAKNKAAKAAMNHEQAQHQAMKVLVEELIEDMIESNNGVSLDHEWASRRLEDLFAVSNEPAAYLAKRGAR